jgi:uncharacterized delta-60 repeat protein
VAGVLAAAGAAAPAGSAPASGTGDAVVNGAASNSRDEADALVIQHDGKIVAAGISGNGCEDSCFNWRGFALARYLPNGRLDRSFGRAGKVLTESRYGDLASAVAAQANGKLVVAGGQEAGWSGFTLIRYTRAGRLDRTFGTAGIAHPSVRVECDAEPRAIAIQADGKIVVAGHCLEKQHEAWEAAVLARYTPDGRLDPAFGDGGSVLTDFGPEKRSAAHAVALQADGKIVIAGHGNGSRVALARFMSNGRLDPTFGSGGKVLDVAGSALALALQPDGRILVAGAATAGIIARYAPDGSPDNSFGNGGRMPIDFVVGGLSLQSDGKVVAAGSMEPGAFAVRRYFSDGAPDVAFGSAGRAVTGFGARSGAEARGVALRDGRIVLAGTRVPHKGIDSDFALARYTTSGRLDRRFGERGKVVTGFGAGVVGFATFSATREKQGVLVRWRTTSEQAIRGFRIYLQAPLSSPERVTRTLIVSRGSAKHGASYVFRHLRAPKVVRGYRYLLQEVSRNGETIWRGQTTVRA